MYEKFRARKAENLEKGIDYLGSRAMDIVKGSEGKSTEQVTSEVLNVAKTAAKKNKR